jgi:V-type H+-transporting ATPase subunit a
LYPGEETKSVIFIIYPAKKDSVLDRKVVKVLDNYSKNWQNYILPQNTSNFRESMDKIEQNYAEAEKMYEYTEDEDKKFLKSMFDKVEGQNITILEYYKFYLLKEKEIYSQLNEMTNHANFIDGEMYVRSQDREEVMELLYKVGTETQTPIAKLTQEETDYMPTHFQLNDYKMPAQEITNTYGVPMYKEANPSMFSCVTFPFMFGMMFGDIAHGLIVFFFGVLLTFQSATSKNTVFRSLYPFRFLVMLMGFFATYCGFIYNDFFSLSLNLFKSCFDMNGVTSG